MDFLKIRLVSAKFKSQRGLTSRLADLFFHPYTPLTLMSKRKQRAVWPGSHLLQTNKSWEGWGWNLHSPDASVYCPPVTRLRQAPTPPSPSHPPASGEVHQCRHLPWSRLLNVHLAHLQPPTDDTGSPRHTIHFPLLLPAGAVCVTGETQISLTAMSSFCHNWNILGSQKLCQKEEKWNE